MVRFQACARVPPVWPFEHQLSLPAVGVLIRDMQRAWSLVKKWYLVVQQGVATYFLASLIVLNFLPLRSLHESLLLVF